MYFCHDNFMYSAKANNMVKQLIPLLTFSILLISCKEQDQPNSSLPANLSKNENAGLQEVIKLYGGSVHFEKGALPITSDSPQKRIFEIKIEDSKLINTNKSLTKWHASNMASLFYQQLKTETARYDEIHTIIVFDDSKQTTTKYPTKDLEVVSKKMHFLDNIISLIKEKKYDELRSYFNNKELLPIEADALIQKLDDYDTEFGTLQSYQPLGFTKKKTADGQSVLQLAGYMQRQTEKTPLSIYVDMHAEKDAILLLQYNL